MDRGLVRQRACFAGGHVQAQAAKSSCSFEPVRRCRCAVVAEWVFRVAAGEHGAGCGGVSPVERQHVRALRWRRGGGGGAGGPGGVEGLGWLRPEAYVAAAKWALETDVRQPLAARGLL